MISDTAFSHLKEVFMDAFDDNDDDRIEMAEMAAILPTDENFFLLFRHNNPLESSVEFMRVWRAYDKDCSGYIEADELKVTTATMMTSMPPFNMHAHIWFKGDWKLKAID